MTKYDKLVKHIKTHGFITKMIAADLYNVYGLAEQIRRMKERGMSIVTYMIDRPNKQAYAQYTLVRSK